MELMEFFGEKSPLITEYEQALFLGKNRYFDVDQFNEIIDYYYFSQDLSNAWIAVKTALNIHPQSFDLLVRKARVLIEMKEFKEAIDLLKYLAAQEFNEPEVHMLLGFSYAATNNLKIAKKEFAILIDLASDDQEKLMYYSDIAYIFFARKNYALAYKYYKLAYELNPKDTRVLYDMAYCLEKQNRNKESKELYIRYLKDHPFSKEGWYNLGVTYTKLNEPRKALEAFDYALAIDPDFSSAIYNKAHILYEFKKHAQSIKLYKRILKLEHNNPSALFFIAKNYMELGKYKHALLYLKKALLKVPYFPEAWFEIGRIFFINKKYADSKRFVIKALKQGEINPEYLKLLGKIYLVEKQFTKAEKAYKLAALANPFDDETWHSYAEVFELSGDINKAIDILLNGKDFVSNKTKYNLKLANLYFTLGDLQNAQYYIDLARKNDPNNKIPNYLKTLIHHNDKFAKFADKPNA